LPFRPFRSALTVRVARSAAEWQGPQAMDSILNYPTYTALVNTFAIPGPNNVSNLVDVIQQSKQKFAVRRTADDGSSQCYVSCYV
jgi:hypothetical protein